MADTGSIVSSKGLTGAIASINPFGSKKTRRRQQFVEISDTNIDIIDDLIAEMRRLSDKGQTKEFNRLAAITKKILDNNAKFQTVVGEVLSDN